MVLQVNPKISHTPVADACQITNHSPTLHQRKTKELNEHIKGSDHKIEFIHISSDAMINNEPNLFRETSSCQNKHRY